MKIWKKVAFSHLIDCRRQIGESLFFGEHVKLSRMAVCSTKKENHKFSNLNNITRSSLLKIDVKLDCLNFKLEKIKIEVQIRNCVFVDLTFIEKIDASLKSGV